MLCYCKKCGRIVLFIIEDKLICDCCKNKVLPVPDEFLIGKSKMIINDELKDQFIEEYVKTSPEFDQYLFEHRDEILAKKNLEYDMAIAHGKAILEGRDKGNSFGVECPYCHAANVKKVSTAGRMVSTGLFGLASNKIGKQWHCNKCGSDF